MAALFAHRLFAPITSGLLALSLLACAGLGFLHWSDGRTIETLTKDRDRLARDNGTLKANNDALEGSIAVQNSAIDAIKVAADSAAAGAKAGQAAAEASAVKFDKAAAGFATLPPLPAGADRCAAASALIRDTIAREATK